MGHVYDEGLRGVGRVCMLPVMRGVGVNGDMAPQLVYGYPLVIHTEQTVIQFHKSSFSISNCVNV